MGAKQSNVPAGTKWSDIQKDRQKYGDVDIPDIPYNKMKEVCAEIDMTVKQSKYLVEFKRELRDALKRKKGKGHTPKLFRLYDKCLHPADEAAGKGETRKDMIKMLTEGIAPVVKDDIVDGFKEEGKTGSLDKEADQVIFRLIHERVHDKIHEAAEGVFRKDAKGGNADESDPELDEEQQAAEEQKRAERKRVAAKQREAEAAAWLAEQEGDTAGAKAVEEKQKQRAQESEGEDAGDDDDE